MAEPLALQFVFEMLIEIIEDFLNAADLFIDFFLLFSNLLIAEYPRLLCSLQ